MNSLGKHAAESAVKAAKQGNVAPLQEILRECISSSVGILEKSGTAGSGASESPLNGGRTSLLGPSTAASAASEASEASENTVGDSSDLPIHLPFSADSTGRSPVLKLHSKPALLSSLDFVRMVPKEHRGKVPILQLVKGRIWPNMIATGDYFLFFKDFEDAAKYWTLVNGTPLLVNGKYATFEFVPDINRYIKHLYTPFLPDLRGLPEMVSLAQRQSKNSHGNGLVSHLVKTAVAATKDSDYSLSPLLERINEQILLDKALDKHELHVGAKRSNKQIERSNCVVLRNVPRNLDPLTIKRQLWDLKWYEVDELCMRKVFTHQNYPISVYILVFETTQDAQRAVQRLNRQHLFYDEDFPIVEAELLDERL